MIKNKGVFVFGYMHCGTSLLQHILAQSTHIYCETKEIKFIEYISRVKELFGDLTIQEEKIKYIAFCIYAIKNGIHVTDNLAKLSISKYSNIAKDIHVNGIDHLTVFFEVYDNLCDKDGKNIWMEGSPNNVFYYDQINEVLPLSKYIVIVRDVRDVLASKKKRKATTNLARYKDLELLRLKKQEKKYSPLIDAYSWRNTYSLAMNIAKKNEDLLIVRYEDLTQSPKKEIERICSFIGIEVTESMFEITFNNAADIKTNTQGIFSNSGQYESVLTKKEISVSQSICKKIMKFYKYDFDNISFKHRVGSVWIYFQTAPNFINRLWNRFRMLGFSNFKAYVKFNIIKVLKGNT